MATLFGGTFLSVLLVSLIASLGTIAAVLGIYKERTRRILQKRLAEVAETPEELVRASEAASFQERILNPLSHSLLVRLGRMTPSGNLEALRKQLRMAGNPGNLAVIDFLGLKMVAGIITAGVTVFYMMTSPDSDLTNSLLFGAGGGIVGLYLPNFWLSGKVRQRKTEISKALPDALDMLTTMVDAGLGFDIALLRLCEKWSNPLTHELERVVHEMRMGVRRIEALRNLADRVDVPELSTFIAVLIQADQLGISIGNILHTQSEQIRLRRRQWVEESAAKMPLKMLPIIVLFIFPALFAVLLGPAVPGLMEAFGGM